VVCVFVLLSTFARGELGWCIWFSVLLIVLTVVAVVKAVIEIDAETANATQDASSIKLPDSTVSLAISVAEKLVEERDLRERRISALYEEELQAAVNAFKVQVVKDATCHTLEARVKRVLDVKRRWLDECPEYYDGEVEKYKLYARAPQDLRAPQQTRYDGILCDRTEFSLGSICQ
jgi:hypothetical protein